MILCVQQLQSRRTKHIIISLRFVTHCEAAHYVNDVFLFANQLINEFIQNLFHIHRILETENS